VSKRRLSGNIEEHIKGQFMGKKKRNKSGNPAASSIRTVPRVGAFASVATSSHSIPVSNKSSAGFYTTAWFEWLLLAIASVISFFALTSRFIGVNVSVLKDEYIYVLDAHYKDISGFRLPNELFQLVYSTTKLCGENFYDCARGIGAGFVIAGSLIIYFLAKYLTKGNVWISTLAAIGTLFGTNGTYAAYFMPEAIFNFLMIAFFFLLLKYGQSTSWLSWIGLGAIFALASLTKPHAFFVLPAVVIYIFLASRWASGPFWVALSKRIGLFLVSVFSINISLSWLSQRNDPTNVFGTYGGAVSSTEALADTLGVETLVAVPGTAWGQILMMILTVGLALPISIIALLSVLRKDDSESFYESRAGALIGLGLANMMAVAAVFEAYVGLSTWMHTRYYSYLIPLALVVLAEAWSYRPTSKSIWLKRVTIGIFTVVSGYAFFTMAEPYNANWVDAPDFKFHIDNPTASGFLIVSMMIAGLVYLVHARSALLVAFILLLAAYLGAGQHITGFLQEKFGGEVVSDDLARILRTALSQEQVDRTVIVGPGVVEMDRVLFGLLSGSARAHVLTEPSSDLSFIKPEDIWLVTLGEVDLEGLGPSDVNGFGYSLHGLSSAAKLESRGGQPFTLSNLCSSPENTGWACGNDTSIEWVGEIPEGRIIDIIFEVNGVDQEVFLKLGSSQLEGYFKQGIWALTLRMSGDWQSQDLSIVSSQGKVSPIGIDEPLVRVLHLDSHE
jgi:phosphoglycerol transferase